MDVDVIDTIPIIDADTHLLEPGDLFTSRVAKKFVDRVPRLEWVEEAGNEAWFAGDRRIGGGVFSMAGYDAYPPDFPPRLFESPRENWDAKTRAARMDRYGIQAEVLYPNVTLFYSDAVSDSGHDAELQIACARAYNDYQTEYAAEAPGRFVPITTLPFWDLDATLAEIKRCADLGHKGIGFSQEPNYYGLPYLVSDHWDPLWALAQDMGLSINFHIAPPVGGFDFAEQGRVMGKHAVYGSVGASSFMSNCHTLSQLTFGGICHRFPDLKFVSVESGIGWMPFALASFDWQWIGAGVHKEHPEYDLMPSEYFKRQIYGCFWFEGETAISAIEQLGPDNFLFETDFPHPTCMSPGPASIATPPREHIKSALSGLPEESLRKILHDNAAQIYHLP